MDRVNKSWVSSFTKYPFFKYVSNLQIFFLTDSTILVLKIFRYSIMNSRVGWETCWSEQQNKLENDLFIWTQLSIFHDRLVSKSSSNGTPNEDRYRFLVTVSLVGLDALSDALVGRISWNLLLMKAERRTVLGPIKEHREYMIRLWFSFFLYQSHHQIRTYESPKLFSS